MNFYNSVYVYDEDKKTKVAYNKTIHAKYFSINYSTMKTNHYAQNSEGVIDHEG